MFGLDVFSKFPSAREDIVEAGMCLAFGRGTACVMHLMRICEVGLIALAGAVGVSKNNNWGAYINEINKALVIKAKNQGTPASDALFYSEASASFDHLRRAWRNPTMHVDRSYTPERAEEIYQVVKSFMRHLSIKVTE